MFSNLKALCVASLCAAGSGMALPASAASSYSAEGSLSGAIYVGYICKDGFGVSSGDVVEYTITGCSESKKNLRFRMQQRGSSGWVTVRDFEFEMSGNGSARSRSGSYTVQNWLSGGEEVRWILNRPVTSSRIDFELDITVR